MADEKKVKAVILRDYWDENEVRHFSGTVIEVTKDELIDGLEKNILARFAEAKD